MSDFAAAIDLILAEEGGYVNDPKDPGGETNFGISKRQYPDLDIKNLDRVHVMDIYKRDYWDKCRCDEFPWPLSLFVFDSAVNQGVDAAVRLLQRALDVAQDGILGVNTVAKAKASKPFHAARFMAFRAMRYQGTRNFDKYGEAWLLRTYRLAMESSK